MTKSRKGDVGSNPEYIKGFNFHGQRTAWPKKGYYEEDHGVYNRVSHEPVGTTRGGVKSAVEEVAGYYTPELDGTTNRPMQGEEREMSKEEIGEEIAEMNERAAREGVRGVRFDNEQPDNEEEETVEKEEEMNTSTETNNEQTNQAASAAAEQTTTAKEETMSNANTTQTTANSNTTNKETAMTAKVIKTIVFILAMAAICAMLGYGLPYLLALVAGTGLTGYWLVAANAAVNVVTGLVATFASYRLGYWIGGVWGTATAKKAAPAAAEAAAA